jgi:H+-transporting ATPase
VVRNLALFNGGVTVLLAAYAVYLAMPIAQIVPLVLVALLAFIPVALPAMFTLAATVGAGAVARRGVLPKRLSALDEAAGMDVLCADKTGTLTRNELAVTACRALPGFDEPQILAMHSGAHPRRCGGGRRPQTVAHGGDREIRARHLFPQLRP